MNCETKRNIAENMIYGPCVLVGLAVILSPLVIGWLHGIVSGLVTTGVYCYMGIALYFSQ